VYSLNRQLKKNQRGKRKTPQCRRQICFPTSHASAITLIILEKREEKKKKGKGNRKRGKKMSNSLLAPLWEYFGILVKYE
jgi:hypothetical protein